MVSAPIIAYYYSQLIGDARNPPTLLATAGFVGIAVIGNASGVSRKYKANTIRLVDADPYIPGANGAQFYVNQNNLCVRLRPPKV